MQDRFSALADRAVHAADALGDVIDEGERLAGLVSPPNALYPAVAELVNPIGLTPPRESRWAERLRGGEQQ